MKGINRYAAAALAAIALQGCAGAAGRGSSDDGAAPPAAAAAADTSNVVRVEDVKKGTILTGGLGGGVKLHGFWHTAPLPLPSGEWEVLKKLTYSIPWKNGITEKAFTLSLVNRDPNAQVRWMQVKANIDIERIEASPGDCPGDYLVVNDFQTSKSGFINRCGYADYRADYKEQPGMMPVLNGTKPDIEAPYVTEVRLDAKMSGGRLTRWIFFVVPPIELAEAGQRKASIARFLQDTGDQVKEFLYNRPALLPDRLKLAP
jgi:hypothetical protein